MSKTPRRGGLGRGLGALIPTAPPKDEAADQTLPPKDEAVDQTLPPKDEAADGRDQSVMSTDGSLANTAGAAEGSTKAAATSGSNVKVVNRVPSVASIASSSATDFYFDPSPVPGVSLREVRPDQIKTNPKQPRTVFDDEALAELTHSIKEFGVLQPIVVRVQGEDLELVMGERRLRASIAAGLDKIPAIVRDTADDAMLRDALLENIHRVQLNPLEEAAAYQQLLEEFGVTHEQLATRIGRSRSQVSNTIRLMNLPVAVQRRVAAGVLSAGHARALLGLDGHDQQDELAGRIVAEGLSVRATEELVALSGKTATARAPRKAAPKITAPKLGELANNLSDALDTRVRVDLGRRKGKITVEFGSIDDLERIVAIMAPQLATKKD